MNPLITPTIHSEGSDRIQSMSGYSVGNPSSAVSWSAILAGAAAAAALSLILLMLGIGLGFSIVSPWAYDGVSATTIGVSTILWLALTQLFASGLGGYLAGRLRTKWRDADTDEVFFRDTAHGFLTWGVATLATAALLTSVIGTIVAGGAKVAATGVQAAASGVQAAATMMPSDSNSGNSSDASKNTLNYFVNYLLRKGTNSSASDNSAKNANAGGTAAEQAATASEINLIFLNKLPSSSLPSADIRYVGRIVAQRSGLTQEEAEERVRNTYASLQAALNDAEIAAKEALDQARKTSAHVSLWLFISLLLGAFTASFAATHGGRCRDKT